MKDSIIYNLEVLEGGYEELYHGKTKVCSIVRSPILHRKENGRWLIINMSNGEKYNCDYDIDDTIQPGLKRVIVDDLGNKIATIEYDSLLNKKITIMSNTYSVSYCDNWDCFILHKENIIAKINYGEKTSNFNTLNDCQILISKLCVPSENVHPFAALIATMRLL